MRETTLLQNDVRQVKNPDVCKWKEKQDRRSERRATKEEGNQWSARKRKL